MTTAALCEALKAILPTRTLTNLQWQGLIHPRQLNNRDYSIKPDKVQAQLKLNIDKVKRESAQTIAALQGGIDLIESLRK